MTVTTVVMEWFRRNDDSMDVGNVMSSNICMSLAICQTPVYYVVFGAVYDRIQDIA